MGGRFRREAFGAGDVIRLLLDSDAGTLTVKKNGRLLGVAFAAVRGFSCTCAANACALLDELDAVGLQYGPGYRTLMQAWGGASNALARLRSRSTHEGTRVHPADLDDALCLGGLIISSGGDGETSLPFAVDDVLLQSASGELWAVRGS